MNTKTVPRINECFIILADCFNFNNPVDPEANNYQGFPSAHASDWSYRRTLTFTNAGTATQELSYWIEVFDPNGDSLIWLWVPSIPVGASTIHMPYGNSSAQAVSDGASTFLFLVTSKTTQPEMWWTAGNREKATWLWARCGSRHPPGRWTGSRLSTCR